MAGKPGSRNAASREADREGDETPDLVDIVARSTSHRDIDDLTRRLDGLRNDLGRMTLDDLPEHLVSEHIVKRLPRAEKRNLASTSRGMRSAVDATPDDMSVTERLRSKGLGYLRRDPDLFPAQDSHIGYTEQHNYVISPNWMVYVPRRTPPQEHLVEIVYGSFLRDPGGTPAGSTVLRLVWRLGPSIERPLEVVRPGRESRVPPPSVVAAALALLAGRVGAPLSGLSVAEFGAKLNLVGFDQGDTRVERLTNLLMDAHQHLQRTDTGYGQSMAARWYGATGGQRRSRAKKAAK